MGQRGFPLKILSREGFWQCGRYTWKRKKIALRNTEWWSGASPRLEPKQTKSKKNKKIHKTIFITSASYLRANDAVKLNPWIKNTL
jgi:hypothetical protein